MWDKIKNWFSNLGDSDSSFWNLSNRPFDPFVPDPSDPMANAEMEANADGFGGLVSKFTGEQGQAKEFLQQNYLQDKAMDFQREREQVAMDYNSESAKVQRMLDAGINPNLIGSSGGSSFQAVSAPSAPAVNSNVSGPLDALMNTVNTFSNVRKAAAEVGNINSDTALKDLELLWKPLREEAQLKLFNQNYENLKKEFELSDESLTEMKAHFEQWQLTSPYEFYKVIADFDNAIKSGELLDEEIKTQAKQRDVADSTIHANEAAASADRALSELYGSEKEKTDVEKDIQQENYNRMKKVVDGLPVGMDVKEKICVKLSSSNPAHRMEGLNLLRAYNSMNASIYNQTIQNAKDSFWDRQWMHMSSAVLNNGASLLNQANLAPYVIEFAK